MHYHQYDRSRFFGVVPTMPMPLHLLKNADISLAEIRKQFEDYELLVLRDTMEVLKMQVCDKAVYTCNCIPLTDEIIKSVPIKAISVDMVRSERINHISAGDYKFYLDLAPKDYFASRERFDALSSYNWEGSETHLNVTTLATISLRDALKTCYIKVICNMEYYFQRPDQLEKDLGRPLERGFDLKRLDRELFSKLSIQIFGKCDDDRNNDITLTNFRILEYDGNDLYATAERGNNYYIFHFLTS
ncbi:hypothetical protein ACOME3_001507 [Neoechinorhynchus agilis]